MDGFTFNPGVKNTAKSKGGGGCDRYSSRESGGDSHEFQSGTANCGVIMIIGIAHAGGFYAMIHIVFLCVFGPCSQQGLFFSRDVIDI